MRGGTWTQIEVRVEWSTLRDANALILPTAQKLVALYERWPVSGPRRSLSPEREERRVKARPDGPGDEDMPDLCVSDDENDVLAVSDGEGSDEEDMARVAFFAKGHSRLDPNSIRGKRALDKEMGWSEVPESDRPTFQKAMADHWAEWLKFEAVRPLSMKETEEVRRTARRDRILRSRFALRDKNASARSTVNPLPLKAKARLVIAGQDCPDAQAGLLKTDAPTVQRTAVLILLQIAASLHWLPSLVVGDISSAFLQGRAREVGDPIYMEQPRGYQLPGTETGACLIRILKGVFGLPDAPRAWWVELSRTLREEFEFVPTQLDQAFFAWRPEGKLRMLLVVHVDDVMIVHDGSPQAKAHLARFETRYPFGDWQEGIKGPVTYTGKTIEIRRQGDDYEAFVHQEDFALGRLEPMVVEKRGRTLDDVGTAHEAAEFKSMCGSLCWLAGLSRPDIAQETNMLQKRQAAPRLRDCVRAVELIRKVQDTAKTGIRIRPISGRMVVACWHDSGLYNSYDEAGVTTDEELTRLEKGAVRSQHGALIGIVSEGALDTAAPVDVSIVDWLSHASRRVVRSTFAAETGGALEGLGRAMYVRAMMADVLNGPEKHAHEWAEVDMPLRLITDCKSLYDHVCRECALCDDRHTALYLSALREEVSAGPQRDRGRAGMLWVPSRHQLADALTKGGLGDLLRTIMTRGTCYLHELSAQELKRQSDQEKMETSVNQTLNIRSTPIGQIHTDNKDAGLSQSPHIEYYP